MPSLPATNWERLRLTIASSNSPLQPPVPPKPPKARPTLAFRVRKRTAILARWLHIYLSMVSFAIVFFFAATGLTLNHPDWFAQRDRTVRFQGVIPTRMLRSAPAAQPDKLAIVELLRKTHRIAGTVTDFRIDDSQIAVSFKGPGYTADAFIDPATGIYDLTETRGALLAVLNDLHRGQNTGSVWPVVIDASAILLCLISLTGLILILFLYKRRTAGLTVAVAGAAVCILLYRLFIP